MSESRNQFRQIVNDAARRPEKVVAAAGDGALVASFSGLQAGRGCNHFTRCARPQRPPTSVVSCPASASLLNGPRTPDTNRYAAPRWQRLFVCPGFFCLPAMSPTWIRIIISQETQQMVVAPGNHAYHGHPVLDKCVATRRIRHLTVPRR